MSEMIERVAKAMRAHIGEFGEPPQCTLDLARAAIEEMLKPTEAMVGDGRKAWLESASDYMRLHESIAATWTAMLQAALHGDQEG